MEDGQGMSFLNSTCNMNSSVCSISKNCTPFLADGDGSFGEERPNCQVSFIDY